VFVISGAERYIVPSPMAIAATLSPDLIAIAPPWQGFKQTVRGLVALAVHASRVPSAEEDEAVRRVLAREAEGSTAMLEIGVGVPHARLAGLHDTVVVIGASRAGLYEAVPQVDVHIVSLVLSPPGAADEHLQTLAGIATLLRSPELRSALLDAPDAAAAFVALEHHARSAPA
jgi:PTS system nitrogen regulatory IIA component